MLNCPHCNNPVNQEQVICLKCGIQIRPLKKFNKYPDKSAFAIWFKNNKYIILIIIMIFFFMFLIVFLPGLYV